ncbi:ATP-binding cassette domain-containing protein [Pseudomonas sp. NPDC007930]|uniref:ABC transporter ATP-binding protein n=1 Tax=Pseudomonas sp. NPDC007930 TaxID=3364417 RepID=UPI0036E5B282
MTRIELHDLRKRFGAGGDTTKAINGVDLVIEPGEFLVLLGPSGCGKTTTLRCLAGLEHPDGGSIDMAGKRVADSARRQFVPPHKRDLGMVFQGYALWPHLNVLDNVAYPVKARHGRRGARDQALAALRRVGLEQYAGRYPAALSGGQQQRVALARALAGNPGVLLFDEPLSNLDATLRIELRQALRALHRQLGYTGVYVTHDQSEALALADRVAVMAQGQLAQLARPETLYNAPASAFVARFVGFENILPAQAIRTAGDGAWYEAGLGAPLWLPGQVQPGAASTLAWRAKHLRLSTVPAPHALKITAQVVDVLFQGGHYLAQVQTPGTRLHVRIAPPALPAILQATAAHQAVYLHIDIAHTARFSRHDTLSEAPRQAAAAVGPALAKVL